MAGIRTGACDKPPAIGKRRGGRNESGAYMRRREPGRNRKCPRKAIGTDGRNPNRRLRIGTRKKRTDRNRLRASVLGPALFPVPFPVSFPFPRHRTGGSASGFEKLALRRTTIEWFRVSQSSSRRGPAKGRFRASRNRLPVLPRKKLSSDSTRPSHKRSVTLNITSSAAALTKASGISMPLRPPLHTKRPAATRCFAARLIAPKGAFELREIYPDPRKKKI